MKPTRATDLLVRLAGAGLLAVLTGGSVALVAQMAQSQPVRSKASYVIPHQHEDHVDGPTLTGWIGVPGR
jgi:hypothetical protein